MLLSPFHSRLRLTLTPPLDSPSHTSPALNILALSKHPLQAPLLMSTFCSQASSAFKTLDPFFKHPLISQNFKLRVYSQIVRAILLHGSESEVYSPAQITKIDCLQFRAFQQISKVQSPHYHRVLTPTGLPCSNEFLLSLSYPILPCRIPSSTRISDSRIRYIGHIPRHPTSVVSIIMLDPSFSLRAISSPFRRGAPRAHWPEITLAEAVHRSTIFEF